MQDDLRRIVKREFLDTSDYRAEMRDEAADSLITLYQQCKL
jgi:hypothetical protein